MVSLQKWRLATAAIVVAIAAYVVLVRYPPERYGFYPVCLFRAATGLLCPGCGGTRAVAALLRGDLREAWRWNALVVGLVPFSLVYAAGMARRMVQVQGRTVWIELPRVVWIALAAMTAAFAVVRNLPG